MNFLDRYHKAVTPSGVNFGKDLMSFWYWTNLGLYLMYKSLYKSHKGVFQWTFYGWYGMSQVADYFGPMLCRRRSCWADVGPLAAMFSRLLGSLHYGSLWWYCILLSVHLCIVYSYFHVCFICSLTIILCITKTVQPTPLVVTEPGRYNDRNWILHLEMKSRWLVLPDWSWRQIIYFESEFGTINSLSNFLVHF